MGLSHPDPRRGVAATLPHAYEPVPATLASCAMNTSRSVDPRRLDVADFALAEGQLGGEWPLAELGRLQEDALPLATDSPAQAVIWSARGELRVSSGAEPEIWLHLQACTALRLSCQRCLQPMTVTIDIRPSLRFVRGEEQAQRLDVDSDDDVLDMSAPLDLRELTEDELILALPLVPRHDTCPQPLPLPADDRGVAEGAPEAHPFAALASWRRGGDKGS